MCDILGISRDKLYKCLKILKDDGAIDYCLNGRITTVRVLKYDLYQAIMNRNFDE